MKKTSIEKKSVDIFKKKGYTEKKKLKQYGKKKSKIGTYATLQKTKEDFIMSRFFEVSTLKKAGLFVGGVLFGTAGIKVLSGRDAKKVYTSCTAAVLRAKDCVMKTVSTIQENAADICAEAQQINEDREAQKAAEEFEDEEYEDAVEEETDTDPVTE